MPLGNSQQRQDPVAVARKDENSDSSDVEDMEISHAPPQVSSSLHITRSLAAFRHVSNIKSS